MHIVTLVALSSSWYVTSKGVTLSKDRIELVSYNQPEHGKARVLTVGEQSLKEL